MHQNQTVKKKLIIRVETKRYNYNIHQNRGVKLLIKNLHNSDQKDDSDMP